VKRRARDRNVLIFEIIGKTLNCHKTIGSEVVYLFEGDLSQKFSNSGKNADLQEVANLGRSPNE